MDLPGTYSLLATSTDEEIARDFVLFGQPDVTLVVVDATRLERNLNLALQVMEITDRVVICLNLMDEAKRHGLVVNARELSHRLGVPVVAASARFGEGIAELLQVIDGVATGQIACAPDRANRHAGELAGTVSELRAEVERVLPGLPNAAWVATRLLDGDRRILEAIESGELMQLARFATTEQRAAGQGVAGQGDRLVLKSHRGKLEELLAKTETLRWQIGPQMHQSLTEDTYARAASIADTVVTRDNRFNYRDWDRALDNLLTNRWTGLPIMAAMLAGVLWLTVTGADSVPLPKPWRRC